MLASINRIETAFGTNLNVSTAGALGWMQFMPATWQTYGVDANSDGRKDPYNPVDAICAAARYLKAAGGQSDLRGAIFAYNHADWYVDEVLLYANQYGKLPDGLVGSLTGLTEGAHFPVAANARYADDISERRALERAKPSKRAAGNAAEVISSSATRRGINIYARDGAPVVAVNDGEITEARPLEAARRLHRPAETPTATASPTPSWARWPTPIRCPSKTSSRRATLSSSARPPTAPPSSPASAGRQPRQRRDPAGKPDRDGRLGRRRRPRQHRGHPRPPLRLPRAPRKPGAPGSRASSTAAGPRMPGYEQFKGYLADVMRFDRKRWSCARCKKGSQVTAGTVLGRIGKTSELAPHVHFAIRPAGRGAPKIDPKPILDGWKLLEATAIYRAAGKDPFASSAPRRPGPADVQGRS